MRLHAVPCTPELLVAVKRPTSVGRPDTRGNVLDDPQGPAFLFTYARALLADDVPVAVIGICPRWQGVCYGFAILSDEARSQHKLSMTREAQRWLRFAEETLGMRRIEAAIEPCDRAAIEWVEMLGFEPEGVMSQFGPGGVGDFILYARLS